MTYKDCHILSMLQRDSQHINLRSSSCKSSKFLYKMIKHNNIVFSNFAYMQIPAYGYSNGTTLQSCKASGCCSDILVVFQINLLQMVIPSPKGARQIWMRESDAKSLLNSITLSLLDLHFSATCSSGIATLPPQSVLSYTTTPPTFNNFNSLSW